MKHIFLFAAMIVVCLVWTGGAAAYAADGPRGEVLLTVWPPNAAADRDGYLAEIAQGAGAVVVKVYDALSLTPDDPLLLLICSETLNAEEMIAWLEYDTRVLSATPNETIRLRKTN